MKDSSNGKQASNEDITNCTKYKSRLKEVDKYKRICERCGYIYTSKIENCEECGSRLAVFIEENNKNYRKVISDAWLYILAVLFPVIGIILGCIFIALTENELGKSLIRISLIVVIIALVFRVIT